ncbi:hypothetical protein IV203_020059 [Nitzschia inconspicua]|uniref:Uncharacterized protein n=1 Tax=Nitzschia inconspicua TaxID=303405 RepID=A0A9K3Q7X2_9STRA|nr:hypothetical protein IV203_020059 [Nitzschia inconspicua]
MGSGWRAKELGVFNSNPKVPKGIEHDNLFNTDYQFLHGWIASAGLGQTNTKGQGRKKNGTFASSGAKTSKAISYSYLNYAWGVSAMYAHRLKKKYAGGIPRSAPPTQQSTTCPKPGSRSVIESYDAASRFFTAKELFIQTRMHEMRNEESHFAYEDAAAARAVRTHMETEQCPAVTISILMETLSRLWHTPPQRHLQRIQKRNNKFAFNITHEISNQPIVSTPEEFVEKVERAYSMEVVKPTQQLVDMEPTMLLPTCSRQLETTPEVAFTWNGPLECLVT